MNTEPTESRSDRPEGAPATGESPLVRRLSRLPAPVKAALILAYFAIVAIWLPSAVLRTGTISSSSTVVGDIVGVGIWAVAMLVGLTGLRLAQRRGVI